MNPHDTIFIENFSKKENTIDLLNIVLPENIKNKIDFDSFLLEKNSYTDKKLKKYFSDLVYTCKYKEIDIKITLLFEHKSYFVQYPHIQLLNYLNRIWEQNIKKKEKLSVVIPIIFYHGKKEWKYLELKEYFENTDESLSTFIPNFEYLLLDLSKYSDEMIKSKLFKSVENRIILSIMKNVYNQDILIKNLKYLFKICKLYLESETGLRFIESVIYYLFNVVEENKKDETLKIIDDVLKEGGDFMTIAQSLRREGKIEGIMEGRKEGEIEGKIKSKIEIAKNMINNGFDITMISKITGLSIEEIGKIEKIEKN